MVGEDHPTKVTPLSTLHEAITKPEVDTLASIESEINSKKEILQNQCKNLNEFHEMFQQIQSRITGQIHLREEGKLKDREIVDLCGKIETILKDVIRVVDHATTRYEAKLVFFQSLVTNVWYRFDQLNEARQERKTIYYADLEEVKVKGKMVTDILTNSIMKIENITGMISNKLEALKAQIENESVADVNGVIQQVSRFDEPNNTMNSHPLLVTHKVEEEKNAMYESESKYNFEMTQIKFDIDCLITVLGKERDQLNIQDQNLLCLKNEVRELRNSHQILNEKMLSVDNAVEILIEEMRSKNLQLSSLESDINQTQDSISVAEDFTAKIGEVAVASKERKVVYEEYWNEAEIARHEVSSLKDRMDHLGAEHSGVLADYEKIAATNNRLQGTIDILVLKQREIDLQLENEIELAARAEILKGTLSDLEEANVHYKTTIEELDSQMSSLDEQFEFLKSELANMTLSLEENSSLVANLKETMRRRDWEQYMERLTSDLMYQRTLAEIDSLRENTQTVAPILGRIGELQDGIAQSQINAEQQRKEITEMYSEEIESKLLVIRNTQKAMESDAELMDEDLNVVGEDYRMLNSNVDILTKLNLTTDKSLQMFNCKQLLLSSQVDVFKSWKEEIEMAYQSECKTFSVNGREVDCVLESSDAEDDFKASMSQAKKMRV